MCLPKFYKIFLLYKTLGTTEYLNGKQTRLCHQAPGFQYYLPLKNTLEGLLPLLVYSFPMVRHLQKPNFTYTSYIGSLSFFFSRPLFYIPSGFSYSCPNHGVTPLSGHSWILVLNELHDHSSTVVLWLCHFCSRCPSKRWYQNRSWYNQLSPAHRDITIKSSKPKSLICYDELQTSITWHMTTSSGLVLLCSFWCHSSIIPPLQSLFLYKPTSKFYDNPKVSWSNK